MTVNRCWTAANFGRLIVASCLLTGLFESLLYLLPEKNGMNGMSGLRFSRASGKTDLGAQVNITLQANISSAPISVHNKAKNDVGKKKNWTALHLIDKEKTIKYLQVLKGRLGSTFITLEKDDEILTLPELLEQFQSLLHDRSLIIIGDSTTRIIFVALSCLLDGILSPNAGSGCRNRMKEAKAKCVASNNSSSCDLMAPTFSNASFTGRLDYVKNYNVGEETGLGRAIARAGANVTVVALPPCLHSVWSPGAQELHVFTQYPTWNVSFQNYYDGIQKHLRPEHSLLFLTTVSVCDSKLFVKPLVDWYLEDKEFLHGGPRKAVKPFTRENEVALAANYSGPIPVLEAFRYNHSCDNALFDEGGALKCTSVGLENLLQHHLMQHPGMKVLDFHEATKGGCDATSDGVHYYKSLIQRRELTLLVKGLRSQVGWSP